LIISAHLNGDFVKHLLQHIETAGDVGEEIGDIFLNIIFAFNLHFELPKENLVMQALAEVGDVKVFTEKLMLLFNRGGMFVVSFWTSVSRHLCHSLCVIFVLPIVSLCKFIMCVFSLVSFHASVTFVSCQWWYSMQVYNLCLTNGLIPCKCIIFVLSAV